MDANPTRRFAPAGTTGAGMEVMKCLKPSNIGHDLVTARVCRLQRE